MRTEAAATGPHDVDLTDAEVGRTPTVDIVIPSYNYGSFLAAAVDSAFAQDHPEVTVTVVDDGSDDDTPRVLADLERRHPALRVIQLPHRGLHAALVAGIGATSGEYFVRLDADDRIEPSFVRLTLEVLEADPAAGYCYPRMRLCGTAEGIYDPGPFDSRRLWLESYLPSIALTRRAAYDATDGLRDLPAMEDWDLWLRLLGAGWPGAHLAETLHHYRIHPAGRNTRLDERTLRRLAMRIRSRHLGVLLRHPPAPRWLLSKALRHSHTGSSRWQARQTGG